jgi:hypothetical protein
MLMQYVRASGVIAAMSTEITAQFADALLQRPHVIQRFQAASADADPAP